MYGLCAQVSRFCSASIFIAIPNEFVKYVGCSKFIFYSVMKTNNFRINFILVHFSYVIIRKPLALSRNIIHRYVSYMWWNIKWWLPFNIRYKSIIANVITEIVVSSNRSIKWFQCSLFNGAINGGIGNLTHITSKSFRNKRKCFRMRFVSRVLYLTHIFNRAEVHMCWLCLDFPRIARFHFSLCTTHIDV